MVLRTMPNDVFVKGPRPRNDMNETYKCDQVKVVWSPIRTEIVSAEFVHFFIDVEPLGTTLRLKSS